MTHYVHSIWGQSSTSHESYLSLHCRCGPRSAQARGAAAASKFAFRKTTLCPRAPKCCLILTEGKFDPRAARALLAPLQ